MWPLGEMELAAASRWRELEVGQWLGDVVRRDDEHSTKAASTIEQEGCHTCEKTGSSSVIR